jgi:Na+/H+ antiporter NhaA
MKEITIYTIAAIATITIFGYSIHMFIGGFVEPQTEQLIITIGCLIATAVIAFLGWDIIKRRRRRP